MDAVTVPWNTPPPKLYAELPATMQLLSVAVALVQNAPPPFPSLAVTARVDPLVRVKPLSTAPSVSQTQRADKLPFVVPGVTCPSMIVDSGPFTLRTTKALLSSTRLVKTPPGAVTPPIR